MSQIALLLVIAQFFTGALTGTEQQIIGLFNIFDSKATPESFAKNLNYLIGPIRNISGEELRVNAKAGLILDFDSNKVLFSQNATDRLPIASITKIMTALVVLDRYGGSLDTVVTVPPEATAVTGSRMSLYTGEKITIHNLLRGTLIESANDAAQALAYFVGGTPDRFVLLMNQRAAGLSLRDTHFANAIGFDDANHYSTAQDLAQLTKVAMGNPTFAKIVSTSKTTVQDISGKTNHPLISTNRLLGTYTNVTGVKTGTTNEAGESLVASVVGSGGQQVVVVLLDSPDRFSEGRKALDWALTSYTWIEPL